MTDPAPVRILTVDLEDWFHLLEYGPSSGAASWPGYESRLRHNTELLLEEFREAGVQATFFTLGWVARAHPGVLRDILAQGHELGSHSDLHGLVHQQTPREFAEDLRRSLGSIEDATGSKVRMYRAPGFSITASCQWAFESLVEAGVEYDSSVFPAPRAHGGFQGLTAPGPLRLRTRHGELRELPVTVRGLGMVQLAFAGGGYFRLLPGALVRAWSRRSNYLMTYFHPRDFDAEQPVLPGLSAQRRFRSYVGLRTARAKLHALLRLGGFESVGAAAARIDWSRTPLHDVRSSSVAAKAA